MKRWNEYCDGLDQKHKNPSKRNQPIDVSRSATVKYLSVYPRKYNDQSIRTTASPVQTPPPPPPPSNQVPRYNAQPAAETSFHGERYIRRSNELNTISDRSNAGHTNYAWVD